jgi:hypothetical protein
MSLHGDVEWICADCDRHVIPLLCSCMLCYDFDAEVRNLLPI